MAKRRLYGAALAAHNRKRGRSSTALARRSSTSVARRGSQNITVRVQGLAKRGRRRRRRGGGGGGLVGGFGVSSPTPLMQLAKRELIGSAGYGFIRNGKSDIAVQANELLAKLPTHDGIGVPASHGLLLHFIAKQLPGGIMRRVASTVALGALHRAAYNLGSTEFDLETAAAMGADDDDEFAGEMEGDEDDDMEGDYDDADVVEGNGAAGDPED